MSGEAGGTTEEASSSSTSNNPASSNTEQSKKPETPTEKTFARYRSVIVSEYNFKYETTENYLKRLQNLRKELNYINDTDWMYDSLDKKPSQ